MFTNFHAIRSWNFRIFAMRWWPLFYCATMYIVWSKYTNCWNCAENSQYWSHLHLVMMFIRWHWTLSQYNVYSMLNVFSGIAFLPLLLVLSDIRWFTRATDLLLCLCVMLPQTVPHWQLTDSKWLCCGLLYHMQCCVQMFNFMLSTFISALGVSHVMCYINLRYLLTYLLTYLLMCLIVMYDEDRHTCLSVVDVCSFTA